MIEKYLNNRFVIVYITPFVLGLIATLSFSPFNLTIINFFIFPLIFQSQSIEKDHTKKIFFYLDYYLVLVSI